MTEPARRRLAALLEAAQGRRQSRRLSGDQLEPLMDEAARAPHAYAWRHGGEVGDPRTVTTVCLVAAHAAGLTVGIGAARAQDVTPARAFRDLPAWDRFTPEANTTAVMAWANRAAGDRVVVPWSTPEDGGDLLRRVVEHPHDEEARRVYADALSEQGDPRGELITVQLQRQGVERGTAVDLALEAREQALLGAHTPAWLRGAPPGVVDVTFSGGFVSTVRVLGSDVVPELAELASREPIERLVVMGRVQAGHLAPASWLARLGALELVGGPAASLTGDVLVRLLENRYLRGLRSVVVRDQPLGDVGTLVLAANGGAAFPSLHALALEGVDMTETGAQALAGTRWLGALGSLSLSGNPLGPGGVEAVAFARSPGRLATLQLDAVRAGNEGAMALARAPRLSSLARLSLERNRIFQRGAQALLASSFLAGLTALSLRANPIGDVLRRHVHERFEPAGG